MMTHKTTPLLDALGRWDRIRRSLEGVDQIHIFSDFDGTLSPIVDGPADAAIDPDVSMVLRRFLKEDRVKVTVLSGRSVCDVKARIGLPLTYAGDHGLEIHGPDFKFSAPGAEESSLELPEVCNRIRSATQDIRGAVLEAKRITASVHYRHVAPDQIPALERAVCHSIDQDRYEIRRGKCVLEVRPRLNWNKGDAVQWLLERNGARPEQAICIGDDKTDEDMFVRHPEAVNVQVGFDGSLSSAQYWVAQSEVAEFLLRILGFMREAGSRAVSLTASA